MNLFFATLVLTVDDGTGELEVTQTWNVQWTRLKSAVDFHVLAH